MVNEDDVEIENSVRRAREQALKLGNDRVHLEEELKEWLSILTKDGIGMDEALVDADGYPRADIDVYQVRQARYRVICIRNDLRNIMKEIEELLEIIHMENANASSELMEFEVSSSSPIAKVIFVSANSPADEAGLKINDLIIHFGSVCSSNLNSFADVKNIVLRSSGQFIKVVVLRNETIVKLRLKPHPWTGLGTLGCIIVPLESVER